MTYGSLCGAHSDFCNVDDPHYVTENPEVQAGLTPDSVRWAFTTFHGWNWHPLTWLSLQLDHELHGMAAWGYHLTNILLHAANAILLFLWLRHVTAAVWRSAFVAVLFLIHPLHVESVAWVTERKDVLSTFFWLLTMWAYGWYVESGNWQSRRAGIARYLLTVACFALGLMAKPMLVTLPCVLLLMDWWPLQRGNPKSEFRNPKQISNPNSETNAVRVSNFEFRIWNLFRISDFGFRILEKLPLLAFSLAASVVTVLAQQTAMAPFEVLPFSARLANAAISYWRYVGKTFWPTDLCIFYTHPPEGWPWWTASAAGIALVAVTALVLTPAARRRPYLAVGWLWFVGTLVPVIGLVQVGPQALADRYTYVPLIGLLILLVWGVSELFCSGNRQKPGHRISYFLFPVVCCLVILALLLITWSQVALWQDPLSFWMHEVEIEPNYSPAYLHAGHMLLIHRDPEAAVKYLQVAAERLPGPRRAGAQSKLGLALCQLQRWDEAIQHLTAAAQLNPRDRQIHSLLGNCYLAQFQLTDAVRHLATAAELDPDSAETQSQLGAALLCQDKREAARRHLNDALRLDPASSYAHTQSGLLCLLEGNHEEGQTELRRTLTIAPNDVAANFYLGWSLMAAGQSEQAKRQYERVRQLAPEWPHTAAGFAWSLATQPDAANRNGALALLHAEAACQATPTPDPEMLDALAAAQAENGRYPEAAATLRRALAQTADASERRAREVRLALYEAGRPFRSQPMKTP